MSRKLIIVTRFNCVPQPTAHSLTQKTHLAKYNDKKYLEQRLKVFNAITYPCLSKLGVPWYVLCHKETELTFPSKVTPIFSDKNGHDIVMENFAKEDVLINVDSDDAINEQGLVLFKKSVEEDPEACHVLTKGIIYSLIEKIGYSYSSIKSPFYATNRDVFYAYEHSYHPNQKLIEMTSRGWLQIVHDTNIFNKIPSTERRHKSFGFDIVQQHFKEIKDYN